LIKKIEVFVSSRIEELLEERITLKNIKSKIFQVFIFEKSVASNKAAIDFCLKEVRRRDVFVLLLWKDISAIVKKEYKLAKQLRKPILVFIKNIKKDEKRSNELKEFIKKELYNSRTGIKSEGFTTIDELENIMRESIYTLLKDSFLEFSDFELSIKKILINSMNAIFRPMKRIEVKSPLELIKDRPEVDKVMPLMTELYYQQDIPSQIEYAKKCGFDDEYAESWADEEQQIIGYYLLRHKIKQYFKEFSDMYDAGSANCAQFKALIALDRSTEIEMKKNFKYIAQDYNSNWEKRFIIRKGKFFDIPLPLIVSKIGHTLISCTHTLHYFNNNPIGMYTCIFSFNKLLIKNGIVYITIPEKSSIPGMIDLIRMAAIDANFRIIESGKYRLIHKLQNPPHNITTFSYVILQKEKEVNEDIYKKLLGASLFKGGLLEEAQKYEVFVESDIDQDILDLEKDLKEILYQKDYFFRTLRFVLEKIKNYWNNNVPNEEIYRKVIKNVIERVHDAYIGSGIINYHYDLNFRLGCYYFWLVSYFLSYYKEKRPLKKVYEVYNIIKGYLESDIEKVRVMIDKKFSPEQVSRLLKHLFKLCTYENIDIRYAFDKFLNSKYILNELYYLKLKESIQFMSLSFENQQKYLNKFQLRVKDLIEDFEIASKKIHDLLDSNYLFEGKLDYLKQIINIFPDLLSKIGNIFDLDKLETNIIWKKIQILSEKLVKKYQWDFEISMIVQ